jgi:nucleoside-diphosphate-sugar epimerase
MNILVTGGAGYIGSVLVPELLKKKYNVTVIDNYFFSQQALKNIKLSNFSLIKGDVRDASLINSIIKKFDIIIPLAALVGAPLCDLKTKEANEINFESILSMKKSLSKEQWILLPVTNSGYGIGKEGEFCTESSPLNPISLYGKTKVAAEKVVMDRENSISFRLATVFGMSERMRIDLLVNHFIYKALIDKKIKIFEGHFKRNYVHIADVARVFLFAIENFKSLKNNTYNFGLENANLSKIELANKIKTFLSDFEILESKEGNDPDKRNYIVSNKKILSSGFEFKNSLDNGIPEVIAGLRGLPNNKINSNV